MAIDTVSFPDFDPVTGQPTLDGFTGIHPLGVETAEAEPGYTNGQRITFDGVGSQRSACVFQGVKVGEFLHLAFQTQYDRSFDNEDTIVVALRPVGTVAHDATCRRIDIRPVVAGTGAGGGPDTPGLPPAYHIRNDRAPSAITCYEGQAAGVPWQVFATPAAIQCRVRSWQPAPTDCGWSVELRIPRRAVDGGGKWIDLGDGFGLYFNVIRVDTTIAPPTAVQYKFKSGSPDLAGGILDAGTTIDPQWYGQALIPALQVPPGSNLAQGVRFVGGELGVGIRPAGGGALGNDIDLSPGVSNRLVAVVENTSTTDAADQVTAEFRLANWGLGAGDFTAWARVQDTVSPAPNPNPTDPSDLAAGAQAELRFDWQLNQAQTTAYTAHWHQCMWVQLDSVRAVNFAEQSTRRNMDFKDLSSIREPAEVSGKGYDPPPGGRGHHDFLLETFSRRIAEPRDEEPGEGPAAMVRARAPGRRRSRWIWIVLGYRRTGRFLTIDGTDFENVDAAPGSFGYLLTHDGRGTPALNHRLAGGGIRRLGGFSGKLKERREGANYALDVPHDGEVTIRTELSTGSGCLTWLALVGAALAAIGMALRRKKS